MTDRPEVSIPFAMLVCFIVQGTAHLHLGPQALLHLDASA
jgi:hypothetical protein